MNEEDLIAVTDGINTDDLILAYKGLAFPWPMEGEPLTPWFSPDPRGLLEFNDFHIARSLNKFLKQTKFRVTYCQNFDAIIDHCGQVERKNQEGTWISKDISRAYKELFKLKKAYSVEVWNESNLIGGMYGVISERYLSGESMFHLETGASKLALVSLVKRLEQMGLCFLDTQMVTPLLKSFGGKEVSKNEFRKKVDQSIILEEGFFRELAGG